MADAEPPASRVLHLIDPPCAHDSGAAHRFGRPVSEPAAALCRALLDAVPETRHEVLVLGSEGAERWARAFGLPDENRISAPAQEFPGAFAPLPRAIRRFMERRGTDWALQPWSQRTHRLAHAAAPRSRRPIAPPPMYLFAGEGDGIGVPAARAQPMRDRLRAWLDLDRRDHVIGLVSRGGGFPDAWGARWVVSLAATMGAPGTLLLSNGHGRLARATDMHRVLGDAAGMRVVDGPILPALGACDAALCLDPAPDGPEERGAGILLFTMLRAHGMPVIAPPWGARCEAFGGGALYCAAGNGAPAIAETLACALIERGHAIGPVEAAAPSRIDTVLPEALRTRILDSWRLGPAAASGRTGIHAAEEVAP